jgi:excisionase family DNA binding protein
MGVTLSPEQAAKRVGVSRRTILRAVQDRELQAVRDNRNRWRIDGDSLDAWALRRAPSGQRADDAQSPAHIDAELVALRVQLAGREAELQGVRELLRVVEADRDAWRDLARLPWWRRLLGLRRP